MDRSPVDRNVVTRLVLFAAGLAAVFGLAFGVGRLAGPIDTEPAPHAPGMVGG